jgi:hypothetical protein
MKLFMLFFIFISMTTAFCPCELNREKLGHSTWYLMHEIAKQPSSPYFDQFIESLSHLYPCKVCRKHFQSNLKKYTLNQNSMSVCMFHNHVNYQLGKPEFNCSEYI